MVVDFPFWCTGPLWPSVGLLAYVVASPRPLDTEYRTVEQMKLANALWRFAEVAESG